MLEYDQFFEILEARIAQNDDDRVHVVVKLKKNDMHIAKSSRMAYSGDTGDELSFLKICNLKHSEVDYSFSSPPL